MVTFCLTPDEKRIRIWHLHDVNKFGIEDVDIYVRGWRFELSGPTDSAHWRKMSEGSACWKHISLLCVSCAAGTRIPRYYDKMSQNTLLLLENSGHRVTGYENDAKVRCRPACIACMCCMYGTHTLYSHTRRRAMENTMMRDVLSSLVF